MDNAHRIVSSEAEELILVDSDDNETGYLSKADCHDGSGVLHRAFSVFLFDEAGRLLLQRRAGGKRLWPGFWSNSCCSHPRRGESMQVATERRMRDELNATAKLEYVYRFQYQAQYDETGAECELCHVFVGRIDAPVQPNDHEIESIRLLSVAEVNDELERSPGEFTPWFRMEWRTLFDEHADVMSRYAM
ncbi:MAG: isopentenyl-diphosphate Delta-isomerase [Woeseiaceae bacterium]|nr:isopentenyl-diphosphate Delta-isomerase [Woeseiaceae bacterium]